MDGPEGIVRDESRSGGPQHRDRQLGHRPLFLEQTKLITLLSAFVSTSSFSLRSTIEVSTQMTIYYEELPDSITREFEQFIRPNAAGWTERIRALRFCRSFCYIVSALYVRSRNPNMICPIYDMGDPCVYEYVQAMFVLAPKTRERKDKTTTRAELV
jgi:hypothetical protein